MLLSKRHLRNYIHDKEAIQHNIIQLTQDRHFSKKHELPKAGLEPVTICVLGRCSTNRATEAAQLAVSNHPSSSLYPWSLDDKMHVACGIATHSTQDLQVRSGKAHQPDNQVNSNLVYTLSTCLHVRTVIHLRCGWSEGHMSLQE